MVARFARRRDVRKCGGNRLEYGRTILIGAALLIDGAFRHILFVAGNDVALSQGLGCNKPGH